MLSPGFAINAKADDIPHENYDLVSSNLNVVLQLLRSTITYSEYGLQAMYDENMGYVDQNLTAVRGLLTPAARLLSEIRDIAESYENLSKLLPPFSSLSSQMDSFASMEGSLLGARDDVVSASRLENMTGDEMLAAIAAIQYVNSLIAQMNGTIDQMLVSANGIINLTVDGSQPFTDNQLIPLIERLRELLFTIEYEVDIIAREGIRWNETQSFSLLWLSAADYYLGEQIVGGGYLYFNGSFAPNHEVNVTMDGDNLTSVLTTSAGRYSFSYPIPVNASWLGQHTLQATAITPNGTLSSATVTIRILLKPTILTLSISSTLLAYDEDLMASVSLEDFRGVSLPGAPCHFILDGTNITFATNLVGEYDQSWSAPELGFGTHHLQAFYEGELPYAPSASENLSFVVDIPTNVSVTLFITRLFTGYYIVGSGTLLANGTTPLADQNITLSVDGIALDNVTTGENGEFAFSIPSEGMTLGAHTLRAEFLHRDIIWRYSYAEQGFSIYGAKQGKYPFFPVIPGWGGLFPPDTFPYLFIGSYAYVFWLLVLLLAGITIRLLRTSKTRREHAARATPSEVLEPMDKIIAPFAPAQVSAEEFAAEMGPEDEGPATPNQRIVWYYQRLLSFLTRREKLSLRASMTHWEVARMLKAVGYPSNPVDRITLLFEQALYSGTDLSDNETVQMSTSMTKLITVRRPGVADAV